MISVASFCLLVVVLALAVWLVIALLELIVRAMLTVGMAFSFAIAIGIFSSSDADSGVAYGILAFGLALVPCFYVVSRVRAAQSARKTKQSHAGSSRSRVSLPNEYVEPVSTFADMQPTLQNGDEVIIQRLRSHDVLHDGLYAVRGSSETFVRRIALDPTKNRISVLTDHPAYPSWSGVQRKAINVVGKVIWIGSQVS